MLAANYSTVRNRFKDYLDQVMEGETVIITRKNQQNAVMMGIDEYNELKKIMRNMEYLKMLDEANARLEAGQGVKMTMEGFTHLMEGRGGSASTEAKVA